MSYYPLFDNPPNVLSIPTKRPHASSFKSRPIAIVIIDARMPALVRNQSLLDGNAQQELAVGCLRCGGPSRRTTHGCITAGTLAIFLHIVRPILIARSQLLFSRVIAVQSTTFGASFENTFVESHRSSLGCRTSTITTTQSIQYVD